MARRVVAARVRFVRYPTPAPPVTDPPPTAALTLEDGAVLADEAGGALSLDA